jgi:hypothetical protein
MCCLRYEHEFYVQQRKRFPKEGRVVVTTGGEEKVITNDIFREQVTLRAATGEIRTVPLAQLNRELGGEPATAASDLASTDDDPEFEEEATMESRLADPPRGADTRTYPGSDAGGRKPEDRRPKPGTAGHKPERGSAAGSLPRPPQQQDTRQQPGGESGGRRRRRRGRRGGRRGRGEGGEPSGGSPPGAGPASTPPPGS